MTFVPAPDHTQASLAIYRVVASNTKRKSQFLISKTEAAQVLTDLFQIHRATPRGWLRGDFRKHPLSRENFLRFVRAYRGRQGLESPREIRELAIYLYGADYQKAIELLDPQDREEEPPAETGRASLELYQLLESNAEAVELAIGAMNVHQWTEAELIEKLTAIPADIGDGLGRLMRLSLSQFSEGVNEAFAKLGGLPQLSLYNLDSLGALWERNSEELAELVSLFEGLHILKLAGENEWGISASVLEFARQRLGELPVKTQRQAENWWRRLLEQPRHLGGFRAHLLSKAGNLTQEVEQQEDSPPLFVFPQNWIEAEWEAMRAFTRYMNSDHFVFAQFLLTRRRRNLFLGLLLTFWMGLSPLLVMAPLWMSASIGAGILALLRLLADVLICRAAWKRLWAEILIRAKPPGADSRVYTCPHGHSQWRGGAHHLLQP